MLTAWAVSEVPSLEIDGYKETSIDGLDRVTCRTASGAVVSIASPTTAEAAKTQDREHAAGRILSAGVRERLGFDVPHTLAAGLMDKRRVVVTEEAQGTPMSTIRDVRPLLPSLAHALANLHSLPTNIVKKGSVPHLSALDCLRDAAGTIDRAHQTTRVPSPLLDRWDAAIEDTELWQFTPTLTHGNLEFDSVLTDNDSVVGVINWASATVGDPASDLKTVVGRLAPEVSDWFVTEYTSRRGSPDRRLGHRARFLAELDIARWLVHGVDSNDEPIVDDAVAMLTTLLASVTDNPATSIGVAPIKPISLIVENDQAVTDVPSTVASLGTDADEAFEDDAPTRVAEPVVDESPVESDEAQPVVKNARAIIDVSETSRTEAGGRPGEVIIDAEVVEIQATIVETFFTDEPRKPADDEIL